MVKVLHERISDTQLLVVIQTFYSNTHIMSARVGENSITHAKMLKKKIEKGTRKAGQKYCSANNQQHKFVSFHYVKWYKCIDD